MLVGAMVAIQLGYRYRRLPFDQTHPIIYVKEIIFPESYILQLRGLSSSIRSTRVIVGVKSSQI